MEFSDPNEILAETYHQSKRINPKTISELSEKSIISNKVDYANGITVYSVADTKAGQEAVRRIIDECWGEDANPWCLAARQNGRLDVPLPGGKTAWGYWEHYRSIPKRIAFKDSKLIAFGASDKGKTEWWDKEDISSSGIPYFVKGRDRTTQYTFNEESGNTSRVRELVKRNQAKIYYYEDTGTVKSIHIPGKTKDDYTEFRYDKDRRLEFERKPDGRQITYHKNGSISEYNPNHIRYSYYPNGNRRRGVREDGAEFHYYENGNLEFEFYPDDWGDAGAEITYYESGYVKDEYYSDGTHIHHAENEQVTQPSRREQYHQAAKRSGFSSRINGFFDAQDTFVGMDGKGQQQAIFIPEQQLEAVRKKYEGTAQWLKAPNGENTKLTEKQWLQVRTENFKRWFGDWERHPELASKVLDENGEPLVVTHISRNGGGFSIFDTKDKNDTLDP